MEPARICVCDVSSAPEDTTQLVEMLTSEGRFDIKTVPLEELEKSPADVALLVISTATGIEKASQYNPRKVKPTIAVVARCVTEDVDRLLHSHVLDFVTAPVQPHDLLPRIRRLIEHARAGHQGHNVLKEKLGLQQLVGHNEPFKSEVEKIPRVAAVNASVLIQGETGTGKEMFARAIHYLSPRSGKPFVPVNCGAIPAELVENELFGHESGAYTSATVAKEGLIHGAEGGTLFLDEIDCLPLHAQPKLLRFLQEREYRPLGSSRTVKGDVRVVAASNADIKRAVSEGRLRSDLYFRLNVLPLTIPSLRHRKDDILLLAQHFLAKYSVENRKPITGFTQDALDTLLAYAWPGNVRELEFTVERAIVFAQESRIQSVDLMLECHRTDDVPADLSFTQRKAQVIAEFEKSFIRNLLITHNGNITHAANAMKKNRRAFWQLMRKYNLDSEFKSENSLADKEPNDA